RRDVRREAVDAAEAAHLRLRAGELRRAVARRRRAVRGARAVRLLRAAALRRVVLAVDAEAGALRLAIFEAIVIRQARCAHRGVADAQARAREADLGRLAARRREPDALRLGVAVVVRRALGRAEALRRGGLVRHAVLGLAFRRVRAVEICRARRAVGSLQA